MQRAGLSDIVQVVAGDAFKEIPEGAGTIRPGVPGCVEAGLQEVLRPGVSARHARRLFLAHNVINKKNDMRDFLSAIETHPQALTTTVSPGHEGISMTYKTRTRRLRIQVMKERARSHHRRPARPRRQSPRHRHGAVGVPHCRPGRASAEARASRSATKAMCRRRFPKRRAPAIRARNM